MAPPNTNSHVHDTPYLDALLDAVPDAAIPPELKIASTSNSAQVLPKFIDAALRLASGGSSRPNDDALLRDAWPQIQASLQNTLHALGSPPAYAKRKRSTSPSSVQAPASNKKSKHEEEEDGEEDPPHLTLHALSATAPVRHKVDITLHTRSLRLAHATTGAPVARSARVVLTRAFLLPTRSRATGAPQWTALLLAGDTPTPTLAAPRKNNGAAAGVGVGKGKEKGNARFELACLVPEAGAVPRLTLHPVPSSSLPSNTRPPTPSSPHQALLSLLSSLSSTLTTALPVPKLVQIERGTPLAGITAFRGARETSLWFFDASAATGIAGILADARPAEFWALVDLAVGDAGVRVLSATGRTCTVILTRRPTPRATSTEGSEDDDEGEETEFQMIDGKEREGIVEWVRKHKSAFGIAVVRRSQAGGAGTGAEGGVVGKGGDSDSDSNFEDESGESDGGSPSSSGSSSGSGEHEGGEESDNEGGASEGTEESAEADDNDDDDEEIVDLDPKRHPLLRAAAAGAIPKMSRAAVDAAIGFVVEDLVGREPVGPQPSEPPPISNKDRHGHDEESEEDELED
ncbi:hypothetical protein EI94DRAFT_1743573 [Lactarius quietus]|nr:hypothetical protein EI94DRAFT_1743573 [Lactarius quietus]